MCKIIRTRRSGKAVYLEVNDGKYWGVKKLPVEQFDFAKNFGNMDFLGDVAQWTTDRDFNDSAKAIPFTDPLIEYSS